MPQKMAAAKDGYTVSEAEPRGFPEKEYSCKGVTPAGFFYIFLNIKLSS
jgi:hypothetical protein